MRATLNDVIFALKQIGGEAQSHQIKDQMTQNFGGVPKHYKNDTSFRETIQVIIQEHCPEEKKYWSGNPAVFRKIRRGRFKLINNSSNSSANPIKDKELAETKNSVLVNIENIINSLEKSDEFQKTFDTNNIEDAREKIISEIIQRRGQTNFRNNLLKVYGGVCAISGCSVIQALEASHITPYFGPKTNHIQNGILLRADIHTLFDLKLIAIDEISLTVLLSSKLKDTEYSKFESIKINLPQSIIDFPSKEALKKHRIESNL